MAPPNFLRSDPTDISNGSPAVFVPYGAYVPEQWYDDRIFVSFARRWWPFRMLLRCEPVEGCARFHQKHSRSALISAQLHGRPSIQFCVERRSQQLCLLCGIACATLVVRALVTLPLQAWSHLLFFVIMAANGATMYFFTLFVLRPSSHLSWSIVPYSGAPISLRRYCTSQPQYASRELQIVRDPTRRNIACSSHPRDKAVQCPQVVVS